MDLNYSERYLAALNLILIAAMAYFAALCVNDIIARHLQPVSSIAVQPAVRPPQTVTLHRKGYYDVIAKRDIFNLQPQTQIAAPPPVVVRDLHLKLLGTSIVTHHKPFAIVEDERSGQQVLYSVGDTIPDAGRLVEVQRSSIVIDQGGGQLATVKMDQTELRPGESRSGAIHKRRLPLRNFKHVASRIRGPGIREDGAGNYTLQRKMVNHTLENMAQLFTQIRAVPNLVGGQSDGFVLSDIQPGSVFQQIGLQNGDILTNVNGQDVRDPSQAFQLFSQLRSAPSLSVEVMRNGAPMQMHYNIQ
ncbi:MAG: PDZ domain-containing protein [Candidatus Binataceae bacterium]|nr:PDZ domain-containing protein [Candidatus Binataceae bacterium]